MKLGDIPDMARYLDEDCYCPGEIYSPDGFFFQVFRPESECTVIAETDGRIAVVAKSNDKSEPQAIIFWRDDQENQGRIIAAQRVDATENNIGILRAIVQGGKPDGRKIDEYEPGSTAKGLAEVMSLANAVIID